MFLKIFKSVRKSKAEVVSKGCQRKEANKIYSCGCDTLIKQEIRKHYNLVRKTSTVSTKRMARIGYADITSLLVIVDSGLGYG